VGILFHTLPLHLAFGSTYSALTWHAIAPCPFPLGAQDCDLAAVLRFHIPARVKLARIGSFDPIAHQPATLHVWAHPHLFLGAVLDIFIATVGVVGACPIHFEEQAYYKAQQGKKPVTKGSVQFIMFSI